MAGYGKIDIHDFYCINCGEKVYSCVRPQAHRREKFHRKKLYCPHCRMEINCIECKDDIEVAEFKIAYEMDVFKEEAARSKEEVAKCVINKFM